MRPSPPPKGLGLRNLNSDEATSEFTHVTARRLAHHPEDGFVSPLHPLRFLHGWDSGYGALTSTPVGLFPTEQASLRWTHWVANNSGTPTFFTENYRHPAMELSTYSTPVRISLVNTSAISVIVV